MHCVQQKQSNTLESLGYSRYVSSIPEDKMFDSIHAIATTTILGTCIGAGCGSAAGGLGAGPGAGIGAAVGFSIGVGMVLARDISEFSIYKGKLTSSGADKLNEVFFDNSDLRLSCPISLNSMFEVPVSIKTCKETFEKKFLIEHIKKSGTCPITNLPIKIEDVKEEFTIYGISIESINSIFKNDVLIEKCTQQEIDGLNLYKKHCSKRLKEFEKTELKNIVKQSEDGDIDLLAASKRLAELHKAKNGNK